MLRLTLVALLLLSLVAFARPDGASAFPIAPPEPSAAHLTVDDFPGLRADGIGDDAPVLQAAVDAASGRGGSGLVLVPSGRYCLADTVRVWSGVRIVGHGPTRPVFVLPPRTSGFAAGAKYLLHFSGGKPKPGEAPRDASNVTFFSGILNVDIEIGAGNPGAVAIRSNYAQHGVIENVDFRLDDAATGIEQVGGVINGCRFFGGRHAIRTEKTSASWQATISDCEFSGQQVASINTARAGLTLIRCTFRDVPRAIEVPADDVEELYLQDCRFYHVPKAAITMDREAEPRNQLNVVSAGCADVPVFLDWRGAGNQVRPEAPTYLVDLSAGLHATYAPGADPVRETCTRASITPVDVLPAVVSDIAPLPPMAEWRNVCDFIALEGGDTTRGFQRAIAEARAIYLPTGDYTIAQTLLLKPDTAIIALGVNKTSIHVPEGNSAFSDETKPTPLFHAPPGGTNILRGFAIRPSGPAPGLVGIKWQAGERSLIDDVHFGYYSGKKGPAGVGELYNIWVAEGGGGTFRNIWTPDTHTRDGLYVTDTSTPGHIYQMSVEHHQVVECVFERVANWHIVALQTEEFKGCEKTIALRMDSCHDIEFANAFFYRTLTITVPNRFAADLRACRNITWRGLHVFSWGANPFEHLATSGEPALILIEQEAAFLHLAG